MTTVKRRARRVAADEAHAWARNLRLNNPHAKLTLAMLSLYVDGDGYCFVSIPTLADDTELSAQTVRSRLVWLEEIGAITRIPLWKDEYGKINQDGRGKRISDRIRLMIDVEPDVIEAGARGDFEGVSREVSPMPQTGLNEPVETVSPTPALRQPYDSAEGLISEPEPESSPKSPSRGREGDREALEESEPEDFEPAWQAWPGHQAMRRDLALAEFRQLEPDKQRLCRAAILPFVELQKRLRRDTMPNFHLWIRQKRFEEFPNARLPDPPPARRWIEGDELAGLQLAARMAQRPLRLVEDAERGRGLWSTKPHQPDLAAMGRFAGDDPATWLQVELGTPQFAAWRDRLALWLGVEVEAERVWVEDHNPAVHDLPALHPNFRLRKSKMVLRVPADWPPHRDGTWATEEGECA
ncbi:helix-turn-helix domain-containing protein [Bradyrhizobium sp. 147]|uniref:helix-turn-helix domain-containing protein n=1 Tax=Bradyrhizobium sp. 147 TaxID=2782623 RepID=UPI002111E37F|nr:helix-turn-helix domain-containing protein [Bradyrhizobium sp. 147]MCK1684265.1 helix-turn-helix domain-containing protein [Bradyrhizobium sp. 147]